MKLNRILFAALAMFAVVGCDNNNSEDDQPATGNTYTISADKMTIEADGVDVVTFTITDQDGNDITADAKQLSYVYLFEKDSNTSRKGARTFSAFKDGVHTFYAKYKGVRTQNEVIVSAQNRKLYEKYEHKICIFQCTGTWCGYCPQMTAALDKVRTGKYADNVIIMAAHASAQGARDPYAIEVSGANMDLGTWLVANYGGSGFPYAVYDLAFGNGVRVDANINSLLESQMLNNPATCGIKISKAQIDNEGNVTIEASVKSHKGGTYDLAYAVLVDNQPKLTGNETIYNDVVMAVSDNFIGASDSTKFTLDADSENHKTWEFKITPFADVEFKASDCKVVVFAHNVDTNMIDNANICAANSSVDYILTK